MTLTPLGLVRDASGLCVDVRCPECFQVVRVPLVTHPECSDCGRELEIDLSEHLPAEASRDTAAV